MKNYKYINSSDKIKKTILVYLLFWNKVLRNKIREYYRKKGFLDLLNLVNTKYKNDYVFFTRNGIGDLYFILSIMREFKKRHTGRIILIIDKPNLYDYIKSFNVVDEIIASKELKYMQGFTPLQRKVRKKQINYLFFPYRGKKPNFIFADSYCNLLDLPLNTKRVEPNLSKENIQNALQEYKKLNISPKKTIILIPESVMFDYRLLNTKFWIKLAQKIEQSGYNVVFNSKNKAFKNFKHTFLKINDFICFAQQARHIISFRSGISDLLAGMGIFQQTTLYPPFLEVIWANKYLFDNLCNKYHEKLHEDEFDNIFHIYSLNTNFPNSNISEIVLNHDNDELQKLLLKKIY